VWRRTRSFIVTHAPSSLTRVLSVNTRRVAHSFIHPSMHACMQSFMHSFILLAGQHSIQHCHLRGHTQAVLLHTT
jgi:hypothetical protein